MNCREPLLSWLVQQGLVWAIWNEGGEEGLLYIKEALKASFRVTWHIGSPLLSFRMYIKLWLGWWSFGLGYLSEFICNKILPNLIMSLNLTFHSYYAKFCLFLVNMVKSYFYFSQLCLLDSCWEFVFLNIPLPLWFLFSIYLFS